MDTVILLILLVLMVVYHLAYVIFRKPKTVGTIIITDEDCMYVELRDRESMDTIKTSEYVILDISHE